jgi:hypothetical protein
MNDFDFAGHFADAPEPSPNGHHSAQEIIEGLGARLKSNSGAAFDDDVIAALAEVKDSQPGLYHAAKCAIKESKASIRDVETAIKRYRQSGSNNGLRYAVNGAPAPDDDQGKIPIDVSIEHLPTLNKLCWQAISEGNKPPILFLYGNQVVRTMRNPDGTVILQAVTPDILRHHLAEWAHWTQAGIKLAKPPVDVVKDVLATQNMPLPRLARVVHVPVFGPAGTLLTKPGFDEAGGILYSPLQGFEALPVPETVTAEDVNAANALICNELLPDFPFASDSDRDNAVALFLLPFVRDMIDGPTPAHLIEASMPGSGKGMLASALLHPSIGRDMGLTTQPRDDDEWRKKITSMLMEGKPSVLVDNVSRPLDSGVLAAALTADVWSERMLGQNSTTQIRIRCAWVITGNNISISTELTRRCVRSRLTPKTDRPEDREDFEHPELLEWVEENRAKLVQAAHVIVKYWLQQGRPAAKIRPMGSFEKWSKLMGGILSLAGYEQFLANAKEFQTSSDTERQARGMFVSTWWEWMQRPERVANNVFRASVSDLLPIADGIEGLSLSGISEKARQTSLGKYLATLREMVIDYTGEDDEGNVVSQKFEVKSGGLHRGRQMWIVNRIDGGA